MNTKMLKLVAALCLLSLAVSVNADGRCEQKGKLKGTIAGVGHASMAIELPDGRIVRVALSEKMKIFRNGEPATREDLRIGDRVKVKGCDENGIIRVRKIKAHGPT